MSIDMSYTTNSQQSDITNCTHVYGGLVEQD